MFRLTLRTKIMLCCVGLVALLELMVVTFVRTRLSAVLRADCLAKGRTMAISLSARSEHLVLTEGIVSLLRLVEDLKESDEDIVYVYVADRKGQVLADTFPGGFPRDLIDTNVPDPEAQWSTEPLDTAEVGLIYDISVPILKGRAGSVHVGISERRIQRTISHFTLATLAIAGIVLLVAFSLAAVVSWVVTQPLRNLTEAAQKIRDGELGQQVVATTRDEVSDLVESFNQMSDELLKQHNVLDDRNRRIRIAQEQAAAERDKLRAMIDSMVEGVIFVDAEGRVSLCNESAERIWKTSAEDVLGKRIHECLATELRSKLSEILEQAKGEPGFAVVNSLEVRDGYYLTSYSAVHGEDGRYVGLVVLSLDISERMALEQEHKRLRDQLFQQEKMVLIGQIAASIAHELNTPLGTILLRSQLIRREMGEDGPLSDLEAIESEAHRCRRIIDSLLGFSRRSEGIISRTDVNSLVRESLSVIENDLALRGISVETDYAADGATVEADSNQIQQVFLNLLANAADAMPDGGSLRIATRLSPDQGSVEVRVTDDGCGMEQGVLDHAFDPFFTTKGRGKGTGLGLAICLRIIEEHEGQIEIQSRPGQGTTVSIRMPRALLEGSPSG